MLDLFVLCALLAAYAGWLLRDGKVSFLQGQLTEKDKAYGHLEKDRDRIQTDGNNQITQLKMDLNEAKREKDTEIAKLTNERNTAQGSLAQLQAMPERVQNLYSNLLAVYGNGPTNRQQLDALISAVGSITNALEDIRTTYPSFALYLNELIITNGATFSLPSSRDVLLVLRNTSQLTAVNTTIDFQAFLSQTNVIAEGWDTRQPPGIVGLSGDHLENLFPSFSHWRWRADVPIAPNMFHHVACLSIQTNAPTGNIPARIIIYSDKSKGQSFMFSLAL